MRKKLMIVISALLVIAYLARVIYVNANDKFVYIEAEMASPSRSSASPSENLRMPFSPRLPQADYAGWRPRQHQA